MLKTNFHRKACSGSRAVKAVKTCGVSRKAHDSSCSMKEREREREICPTVSAESRESCAMRVIMSAGICRKAHYNSWAMRVIMSNSACRKARHSSCAMRVIMANSTCRKARHSSCAVRVIMANSTCRKARHSRAAQCEWSCLTVPAERTSQYLRNESDHG